MRYFLLPVFFMMVLAGISNAQIELGVGYSRLDLSGSDKNFDGADGWGADLRLIGPMLGPALSQLRFGTDLGFRTYDITGDGTAAPNRSKFTFYTGELRASWRQEFGTLFIEPSVGAGVFYGKYSAFNSLDISKTFDDSSIGWSLRPGVSIGAHLGPITAGAEASYRYGHVGFDRGAGGNLREFYAGIFAGISF